MVISVLARGGCERQLFATTCGLLQRGYTVEIFTLTLAPLINFEAEFASLGLRSSCAADFVDALQQSERDPHGLARFRPILPNLDAVNLGAALEQAIKRFDPGVVHCWSEPSSVIGGLVASALRVPRIIIQLVNVPAPQQMLPRADLYRDAYRFLLRNPDARLCDISVANARNLERWLEVPSGTVTVLRNGFFPNSMRTRNAQEAKLCRQALGIPVRAPIVGAIMRFAPEKDPELWIETALLVALAQPDVYFLLCGYGVLAEKIARRIEDCGLSPRCVLLGPAIDIGAVYACMDVFLMTSRYEGTPNTLIEAQAAGVPVVAPDVGGISEVVLHGRTGLLTATRDPKELAQAVLRILNDHRLRRVATKRGPRFVARQYGWRRKIDRTISLYRGDSSFFARTLSGLIRRIPSFGRLSPQADPPA